MTARDDDSSVGDQPGEGALEDGTDDSPARSEQFRKRTTSDPPPGPPTYRETDDTSELLLFGRDVVVSILAVALMGGYIFMISGVWPPMVAIESGSMEPNMNVNDLVFVMDSDRFQPDAAHGQTGVVAADVGETADYEQYGQSGDVVVFNPQGNEEVTPIIHRAMLWVENGENWYDRADQEYIGHADNCEELVGCPAPHAGFITKGDNNPTYDQSGNGRLDPVKSEWVVGTAEVRIPGVGWLRLQF